MRADCTEREDILSEYKEAWDRINEYTKWRWVNRHTPNTDLGNDILRAYEQILSRWLVGKIVFRVVPFLITIASFSADNSISTLNAVRYSISNPDSAAALAMSIPPPTSVWKPCRYPAGQGRLEDPG